jgi:ribonuclease HI
VTGLHAWFDGACEPVNPGGVGTWAFVVRQGQDLLATRHGRVPEVQGQAMTNNVAEYFALVMLAEWLRDNGHGEGRVHGDSKIVVSQVKGEMKANAPHLRHLRDLARAALPPGIELLHVMRESNGEADALTHRAYVEALRADPALQKKWGADLATPAQLAALQREGIPSYPFMGKREASRLLSRSRAAAPSE